jgi:DNA-binding NarL/FixJ family response regulator
LSPRVVRPHHQVMDSRPVTVSVVSDHPIVAAGIRTLLTEHADRGQFAFVPNSLDADVVIYDAFNLAVAEDHNDELAELVASHPNRVLALSRLLQPGLTARALAAGAVAPISIGADADELVALVEATTSGAIATNAQLARENLDRLTKQLRADVGLTAREKTVLALIAAGYSNDQIAADLYLSINTVKTNVRRTYSRLGVRTRAQAVAWAIEHGYATAPSAPGGRATAIATN